MAVVIQASSLQCLRLDLHTEAQVTAQLNSQDPTLPTTRWAPQEAGDTANNRRHTQGESWGSWDLEPLEDDGSRAHTRRRHGVCQCLPRKLPVIK